MEPAGNRIRVALTGFDNSRGLRQGLLGLEVAAFLDEQLGIAAIESAFDGLGDVPMNGTNGPSAATRLTIDRVALPVRCADQTVLVSGGTLWPALACFGVAPGDPLFIASWMEPRLGRELAMHLRNGDILLAVRAHTPAQQRQATQILLQHGSHRVHTHDFTYVPGAQTS